MFSRHDFDCGDFSKTTIIKASVATHLFNLSLVACGGGVVAYSNRLTPTSCVSWRSGESAWKHFATLKQERTGHTAVVIGNSLLLLGGHASARTSGCTVKVTSNLCMPISWSRGTDGGRIRRGGRDPSCLGGGRFLGSVDQRGKPGCQPVPRLLLRFLPSPHLPASVSLPQNISRPWWRNFPTWRWPKTGCGCVNKDSGDVWSPRLDPTCSIWDKQRSEVESRRQSCRWKYPAFVGPYWALIIKHWWYQQRG